MRTAEDPITWNPNRIAVAGSSGAGKTTLCTQLAELTGFPRVEIDSLYWGAGWAPRESFTDDVDRFTSQPRWVMEWQYRTVRPLIAQRADTLLWLDYSTPVKMQRLIRRTVSRRLGRRQIWNGNIEPPLWTILTRKEHIIRWGWATRNALKPVVPTLEERFGGLTVVRLASPAEARRWLSALERALSE
ncbi:AAA family ATPase [Nesterenkonia sp.]|uniref:AAA family ATPase n=1 Tax=Nesterenkonia sp. TaxID=704201 RepID=UPI00260279BA|nr:AAA family ATPase [Nesterenkonia sp.]